MLDSKLFPPEFIRLLSQTCSAGMRTTLRRITSARNPGFYNGDSMEFQDYRPYHPGDDLRFLDCNLFARSGKLFLRRYRQFPQLRHQLILDMSNSLRFSELRSYTAWRTTALLGAHLMSCGDTIQLVGDATLLEPGPESIERLCELLVARYKQPPADFPPIPPPSINPCWVISDFYAATNLSALEQKLKQSSFLPIRILEKWENEPQHLGRVTFIDAETRNTCPATDNKQYQQALQAFLSLLQRQGHRSGGRLFQIIATDSCRTLYRNFQQEFSIQVN